MNISGVIKTEIICNEDRSHVYEITKDLGVEGEEIILLSLYPTITEVNSMNLSIMHMCKLSPETASCAMFGGHALP